MTIERETRVLIPDDRWALLVRHGAPEAFLPPGQHVLPPGRVEVRLLPLPPASAEPDLGLPFERSLLHVDGDLVGILIPSNREVPTLSAWEGPLPARLR